jgi:acetyl-CoA synthetase
MSGATADPVRRVEQLLARYGDERASVAELLCDRHPADAVAYTVVAADLSQRVLTYGELRESSQRFAAALAGLGVGPGDRVATLMDKSGELLVALLGIWRLGAVQVPLFTAFAPNTIATRLADSAAKVVVCDQVQRPKLAELFGAGAPGRIIVTGKLERTDLVFGELLARHDPGFPATVLDGRAPLMQMYTSGTTGLPKGLLVPKRALASFHTYLELALDLRPDDMFWNAADTAWGYGLHFGIVGSLCVGTPSVLVQGGFSAETTFAVLSKLGVTNYTAAPTVYRALRASGIEVPADLRLRRASAAGEPLTPEVNQWAERTLGVLVHDHYGQTETGMLINNHHHPALRRPLRQGSMGHPMPGWGAAVLHDDRDEPAPPGTLGRIALDLSASPLAWFTGYLGRPEKTAEKFTPDGRWYLTGDSGTVDEDGYFHFLSRDDDLIIMAGYRIGPFDVESVLVTHPAVAEAAVIAVPDQLRGEVLESYVVLRETHTGTPELAEELQQLVKSKYATHAYPRRVHFIAELPKTPSGKIQRSLLRQRRRAELAAARS